MRPYTPSSALFAVVCALTCCTHAHAQAQASTWCFGRHVVVDFTSGDPVVDTNSGMVSVEGCTTMSNATSGTLFYADGDTVWNADHQPMPNGTAFMGHWSCTQTVLTVPFPGDPDKYYLFHTDANENAGAGGLHYSVIDMTLDGGLGAVSTANVPLQAPTTEKLAGVRHANGIDYWVVAHALNSADFLSYHVSSSGVDAPVVSTIGPSMAMSNSVGQMKFSPDGTRLAAACLSAAVDVQLFHFDLATGVVYDNVQLSSADMYGNYGVEFSPSGHKLYVGSDMDQGIRQFDLSAWNATDIMASSVVVGTGADVRMGALQLAVDGKIYAAHCNWSMGGTHLGAIQYPEADGVACTYVDQAVDLNGERCFFGLPSFLAHYFKQDAITAIPASNTPAITLPSVFGTEFTVQVPTGIAGGAILRLWDARGRCVIERAMPANGIITLTEPPGAGAYLLLITAEDGRSIASGRVIALR